MLVVGVMFLGRRRASFVLQIGGNVMTDNGGLSDCEKTIMNPDEPIYGDLITEIDLEDDATTDDKGKESLTDIIVTEQNNEPGTVTTDIPTESESYVTSDVLSQDDAVSEFFAVDSKPDEFDNDMLISELDSEGIDFKNETDVAECHHEYESKKLLEFVDCEDIVEVVNNDDDVAGVRLAVKCAWKMPRCFVTNCGNYYSKTKSTDVIYHVFPNCKKLAIQWMILCAKETQGQPPKYARVCSNHFSSDCYQRDLQHELLGLPIRKKLKPEAVPDLHLPKLKPTKRKYRIDAQIDEKNKQNKPDSTFSKKNFANRKDFVHYGSVIVKTEPKLEPFVDLKLPVRSSIRIAKRRSIEQISGVGNDEPNIETSRDKNNFSEKIKFMSRLHLKVKFAAKQHGEEEEGIKIREDTKRDDCTKCESGTTSSVAPAAEGYRLMPWSPIGLSDCPFVPLGPVTWDARTCEGWLCDRFGCASQWYRVELNGN
ncbi:uncharacterized protein CBL_14596 [Carabus blaptoides fortunei]